MFSHHGAQAQGMSSGYAMAIRNKQLNGQNNGRRLTPVQGLCSLAPRTLSLMETDSVVGVLGAVSICFSVSSIEAVYQ